MTALYVFSDKSAIRFIPRENGVHSIDVKFNGCHIPGSPFNVRVGDPGLIGDPGMVAANGPGLQGGTTGVHVASESKCALNQLICLT